MTPSHLRRRASPHRLSVTSSLAVITGIFLSVASSPIAAQERVPVVTEAPAEAETAAAAERGVAAPQIIPIREFEVTEVSAAPVGDDEPEFAPSEEVLNHEGMVTGTRLVGDPYRLAFIGGELYPTPGVDERVHARIQRDPHTPLYVFVMLEGRFADPAKHAALEARGAVLLGAHTWQCVKARIPVASLSAIEALPFVRWIGFSTPEQKLDPELGIGAPGLDPEQRFEVWVNLFEGALDPASPVILDGEPIAVDDQAVALPLARRIVDGDERRALEAAGLDVTFYCPWIHAFRCTATPAQIAAIVDLEFVLFVEPVAQHRASHDQAIAMISQDRVRGTYPGTDAAVGVIDSGIDTSPWHQDLSGKFYLGWDTTSIGPYADGRGHGQHVSGTIFGRGLAQARYRGCAPSVGAGGNGDAIFIGRYLDDGGRGVGSVSTLYSAFSTDHTWNGVVNPKPQVVNNSWGAMRSAGYSGTEAGARAVDTVVYDNDQCYVFAAGNTGSVSGTWAGSPGSAKNALTVGGVQDHWASGTRPGDPYASTRWATTDNRFKPEVVAVGSSVTSANINTTDGYTNKSGTSMATPHVTGSLASLLDRTTFYRNAPAAMKSLAVGAAKFNGRPTRDSSQKLGYGTINSYKMNFATSRHTFQTNKGTLSTTGNYAQIDFTMPADVYAVKVVLSWTEAAASSGASAARVNQLRGYFDVAPFSAGGNVGEHSMSSGSDNTIYYVSYAGPAGNFATRAAGNQVRFKVYAHSVSSPVNWGHTIFVWRKSTGISPTLTSTVSDTIVQPSTLMTMTGTLTAPSTADDFDAARIYPVMPAGWTVTQLSRTLEDNILQIYTGSGHPSSPYPSLISGMTVGQGIVRPLEFTLRSPSTSGDYTLRLESEQFPGSVRSTTRSVCVDGLAPNTISRLRSTTHTVNQWSNQTSITYAWTAPTDNGCAGIEGLAHTHSQGIATLPSRLSLSGTPTSTTLPVSNTTSRQGYHFSLRAVDRAINLSTPASVGPFLIDTTDPTLSSVTINSSAVYTTNLTVPVTLAGTDTYSGIAEMRYSSNNSTFSSWVPYASSFSYDLSSFGGNSNAGVKRIYVQIRDHADNRSSVLSDDIHYWIAPLRTLSIQSQAITGVPIQVSPLDVNEQSNVSTNGNRTYGTGTLVALNAPASQQGRSFVRWTLDGALQPIGDRQLNVTMSGNRQAVAMYGQHINGAFSPYGTGCSGSGGVPVHFATGTPEPGQRVDFRMTGGPANASALVVFGVSTSIWGSFPLPFQLPGTTCYVLTDVVETINVTTDGTGAATLQATVPDDPTLVNSTLFTQFVCVDPTANTFGLTTSNGVQTILGGWFVQ